MGAKGALCFFREYARSIFGQTAKADFTACYRKAKDEGGSFFLYSLHWILNVLNSIPEFRNRIEDGRVVQYDHIGASPTIAQEDGTSGFAYFAWHEDLDE